MNIFKEIRHIGVIAFISIFLLGCQYGLNIKIIQNNEDKNISFLIHDKGDSSGINISSFTVYKCSDIKRRDDQGFYPTPEMSVWRITSKEIKGGNIGSQIKYGSISNSAITHIPPKPLANGGCYVVYAGAIDKYGNPRIATMGFKINTDGTAFQLNENEYQKLFKDNKG